jgi:hypothetical protein
MQEISSRYPGWGEKLGASVIAVIAVNLLAGPPLCKWVRVSGGTKPGKEIYVKVCVGESLCFKAAQRNIDTVTGKDRRTDAEDRRTNAVNSGEPDWNAWILQWERVGRIERKGGGQWWERQSERDALRFAIRAAGEAGVGGSEAPSVADPDDTPIVADPDEAAAAAALEAGPGDGQDGGGVKVSVADGGVERDREFEDDVRYWGRL